MTDEPVGLSIDDGVATVTLNQPDRRNALSSAIAAGIHDALDAVEDRGAGCVVLEGAGGVFSAGGDIERLRRRLETDRPVEADVREVERSTHRLIKRVATVPVPTIAKIDGPAVGAGANLAIACDLQVGSDQSRIGFVFRNVGLSVDSGTSYFLPRLVGENVAKELVYTGEMVPADRAHELGLLNHVSPAAELDEHVRTMAEDIAAGPTVALRQAKRLLGSGLEKSLDAALHDEAVVQGLVFETDDHREGVEAFFEGRDPEFRGS